MNRSGFVGDCSVWVRSRCQHDLFFFVPHQFHCQPPYQPTHRTPESSKLTPHNWGNIRASGKPRSGSGECGDPWVGLRVLPLLPYSTVAAVRLTALARPPEVECHRGYFCAVGGEGQGSLMPQCRCYARARASRCVPTTITRSQHDSASARQTLLSSPRWTIAWRTSVQKSRS